ncbi:MAG: LLM class F420-dependent oxidoreductase [Chloroflexi bacterium]|nr:LLM class F420-dependent oxidoreductase [Chloroflexota bacterium]
MRISLFRDAGNIDQLTKDVQAAERDGFHGVWFGQIFGGDTLTAIALVGAQTERIELGTGVIPTYLHHPFSLAQQALTVGAAAGGRFVLGIGPSHQPVVEQMWGLSYEKPARHVREYLSVLRPLMDEGHVSFSGDVYKVNAGVQVPGAKPVPIIISALAPMMLRIAGELADGTVTWMAGRKAIETYVAPRINKAAQEAGRPAPRVCVALPVAVTNDLEKTRERAAQVFNMYGQLVNYRRVLDIEGVDGPANVGIFGTASEIEQQFRAFADAGATDLLAAIFPGSDDAEQSMQETRDLLKSLISSV